MTPRVRAVSGFLAAIVLMLGGVLLAPHVLPVGAANERVDVPTPTSYAYDAPGQVVAVAHVVSTAANASTTPTANTRADASGTRPGSRTRSGSVRLVSGFVLATKVGARLGDSGFVDPNTIKFSQRSIGSKFRDGRWVNDLVENLRSGAVDPSDVPAIRIYAKDGAYVSLDNRRLEAFRRAGVEVPYRTATPREIQRSMRDGVFDSTRIRPGLDAAGR